MGCFTPITANCPYCKAKDTLEFQSKGYNCTFLDMCNYRHADIRDLLNIVGDIATCSNCGYRSRIECLKSLDENVHAISTEDFRVRKLIHDAKA